MKSSAQRDVTRESSLGKRSGIGSLDSALSLRL